MRAAEKVDVGRWRPYRGDRVAAPGARLSVVAGGDGPHLTPTTYHACVWPDGDVWRAYYERVTPGLVLDEELPERASEAEARRDARAALLAYLASPSRRADAEAT